MSNLFPNAQNPGIDPSKFVVGVRNRLHTLWRYAAAAPNLSSLPAWLTLAALRSRLFGGSSTRRPRTDGQPRNLGVPIGRNGGEEVMVDLSSSAELDAFEEVFIDRIYPLSNLERPPAMILDCGANVGFFASLCRVCFPGARIVCWEPEPRNFTRLVSQPMLRSEYVQCHQLAVSDSEGQAFLAGQGVGGRIVSAKRGDEHQVETCNLAKWMKEKLELPALVKIDIEGHEFSVVETLSDAWKRPCTLFLETHANCGKDEELIAGLASAGFRMRLLRVHSLGGDSRVFKEYCGELGD